MQLLHIHMNFSIASTELKLHPQERHTRVFSLPPPPSPLRERGGGEREHLTDIMKLVLKAPLYSWYWPLQRFS